MKIELKLDDKTLNIPRMLILGISFLLFIYMLRVNAFVPYWNDEFAYSFVSGQDKKIDSIGDIIRSQYNLYHNWTGRVLVHFLVQFFLWQGKDLFNIINAVLYVLLIFTMCSYTKIRKFNTLNDVKMFVFVTIICWFFLPVMGQTTFWLAGSVNYLWATVALLLLLLPFRYAIQREMIIKDKWPNIIGMFLLGLFVGWSQENAAVICIVFLGLSLLIMLKRKIKLPYWFISGFIGSVIGFLYLVLAPGNQVRKKVMYFDLSLKDQVINFMHSLKSILLYEQRNLFLFLIIAFVFYIYKQYRFSKSPFWISILVAFTGGLSYLAMIASPEFPIRATFAGVTMIIISITMLISLENKYVLGSIYILIIPLILSMYQVYSQYNIIGKETENRISLVNKSLDEGKYDVKLPKLTAKGSDHVFIFDITLNANYTSNEHYAKYYGLNSVAIDKPTMTIELAEPLANEYQLYYDIGHGIKEEDSSKASIYNQVDGNKLYFELPNKPIYKFRFDPGVKKALIKIKNLTVSNAGKTITYNASDLLRMFKVSHDIEGISIKDNVLEISTIGSDPQVEFTNDYTQGVTFEVEFIEPQTDFFQVFYNRGNGFNENDSIIQNLNNNKVFKAVLPLDRLNNFRFDIGTRTNKLIGIKSIIVKGPNSKRITLDSNYLKSHAESLNQVVLKKSNKERVDFYTNGYDPSFSVYNIGN